MKQKVGKVVYDTDGAKEIRRIVFGEYGQSDGYEEVLYQNEKGLYFLYVNGGKDSIHPREAIIRKGKNEAEEWLAKH